jgi:hypothetical protein
MAVGSAHAQSAPMIDPEDAVAPVAIVEGAGVKVGEGTVLHPQIGVEGGMVSNVFFTNTNPTAAAFMRVLGEVGAGSLSAKRLATTEHDADHTQGENDYGQFEYRADLRASYDYYLSDNDRVTAQDGLGLGALFRGIVHPGQPLQFLAYDNYSRLIRPTNFESNSNTNRDINDIKLQVMYAPSGRSLAGIIHYESIVDAFEQDTQKFADRFQNLIGFTLRYQWLPQTRVYADVSQGVYTGISSSVKVTSYPLMGLVGVQTLLSPLTSIVARAGYQNGFYASGPSYSSALAALEFGWRYAPQGHFSFLYNYLHNDSINANYYRDHQFFATLEHALAPFDAFIQAGVIFREYNGVIVNFDMPMYGTGTRDDFLALGAAEFRYNFKDWLAASLAYHLTIDNTNFRYTVDGVMEDPSYVRHEVLLGIRAAY